MPDILDEEPVAGICAEGVASIKFRAAVNAAVHPLRVYGRAAVPAVVGRPPDFHAIVCRACDEKAAEDRVTKAVDYGTRVNVDVRLVTVMVAAGVISFNIHVMGQARCECWGTRCQDRPAYRGRTHQAAKCDEGRDAAGTAA